MSDEAIPKKTTCTDPVVLADRAFRFTQRFRASGDIKRAEMCAKAHQKHAAAARILAESRDPSSVSDGRRK